MPVSGANPRALIAELQNGAELANYDTKDVVDLKISDAVNSLTAAQIPALDAGKITTGTLNLLRIPEIDAARVPNLDASKITSGTLNLLRIPAIDAERVPNLDAGKITSGTLDLLRIPAIDAGRINIGLSQITPGSIGSILMLSFKQVGQSLGLGSSYAASDLGVAAVQGADNDSPVVWGEVTSDTLAGTWRCLSGSNSRAGYQTIGIFIRIA